MVLMELQDLEDQLVQLEQPDLTVQQARKVRLVRALLVQLAFKEQRVLQDRPALERLEKLVSRGLPETLEQQDQSEQQVKWVHLALKAIKELPELLVLQDPLELLDRAALQALKETRAALQALEAVLAQLAL
jgi:hypothetical protein